MAVNPETLQSSEHTRIDKRSAKIRKVFLYKVEYSILILFNKDTDKSYLDSKI